MKTSSLYFLFWRIRQVLSENLHPVLDSLGFNAFKQPSPPSELDALFRVRDKKSVLNEAQALFLVTLIFFCLLVLLLCSFCACLVGVLALCCHC